MSPLPISAPVVYFGTTILSGGTVEIPWMPPKSARSVAQSLAEFVDCPLQATEIDMTNAGRRSVRVGVRNFIMMGRPGLGKQMIGAMSRGIEEVPNGGAA